MSYDISIRSTVEASVNYADAGALEGVLAGVSDAQVTADRIAKAVDEALRGAGIDPLSGIGVRVTPKGAKAHYSPPAFGADTDVVDFGDV